MSNKKEWGQGPSRGAISRLGITVLREPPQTKKGREIFNVATIERAAEQLAHTSGTRPLLGRLKYLRAMSFPSPVPKGRGTKAVLGLDETVQTLFALELINAGMAPTRVIRVMRTDWTTVKEAIAYGWSRANGMGDFKRPRRALVLAPSVLSELGSDDRADEPLHEVVGILSSDEVSKLQSRDDAPRRMLIIETQAFAVALTELADSVLGVSKEKFAEEMRTFCTEVFGTAKAPLWDVKGLVGATSGNKR